MIEPFLYLAISFVFTVISAYFGGLVWFSYDIYIEKVKSFQVKLKKAGIKRSTYVEQFTETRILKWLARMVYLFMFSISFTVLLLTLYSLLIKLSSEFTNSW